MTRTIPGNQECAMRQFQIAQTLLAVSLFWASGCRNDPTSNQASSNDPKAGQERDDNGFHLQLVWCPPGKFTMGSPISEKYRAEDEDQVATTLSQGFWLGKHEVTQEVWEKVMGTTPWKGNDFVQEGPDYPA